MAVTLLGMVMEVRPVQPEKALLPIYVTLLGMFVFTHPAISVFVDVSIIALHASRESYLLFPLSTTRDVKPAQPEKTPVPIVVTLLGMKTDGRLAQPEKAELSMMVTL